MPLLTAPARAPASGAPEQAHSTQKVSRVVEWLLLFAVAAYVGGRALPRAWHNLNTDFPNYYVTARLLREGYNTNRVYEWIWLQRQKDRMGIKPSDQPVVGFVPHTPFSALLMWPLTHWPPLIAKRIWIVCNLLLVAAVAVLLQALTRLPWRRIALLIGLNYPLLRNLEYGQYYLLLLLLITAALWAYLHEKRLVSGVLLGVAAGLKIFPVFFLLYFLRKRDLRAAVGLVTGALATVIASVLAFGLQLHQTYISQVLPWALRGEAMNPYALSPNSISALLHKLFIFEPQWNPNPAVNAPIAFAFLHPVLQMLVLAPAIFLVVPRRRDRLQIQLEWSAFLVALLAISTLPASYHFTLLIMPVTLLVAVCLRRENYSSLALLLVVYLAICFPAWPRSAGDGWWAILAVPRLYLVLLLCGLGYAALNREEHNAASRDRWTWATALAVLVVVQVVSAIHHQRGVYDNYRSHLPTAPDVLLAADPTVEGDRIDFIAMRAAGYRVDTSDTTGVSREGATDQLSHTRSETTTWIEEAGTTSQIVRFSASEPSRVEVADAQSPVVSPDGKHLAYLRSDSGRNALWLRALDDPRRSDVRITPSGLDVEEMTFLQHSAIIFSAEKADQPLQLYLAKLDGAIQTLGVPNTRYPAASADGRWLAYSELDQGVWNLWLRDLQSGASRRLTNANCNDISPVWDADSKTIVYASDCGRALWFTGLNRTRVIF